MGGFTLIIMQVSFQIGLKWNFMLKVFKHPRYLGYSDVICNVMQKNGRVINRDFGIGRGQGSDEGYWRVIRDKILRCLK